MGNVMENNGRLEPQERKLLENPDILLAIDRMSRRPALPVPEVQYDESTLPCVLYLAGELAA